MQDVDDNVPLMQLRTPSEAIDRLLFNQRLMAPAWRIRCAGPGSGLHWLVRTAVVRVVRRTREIGVRTALGAQRSDVLATFLHRGLVVVLLGSAAGVGAAAGVTRLMAGLLYGVRALDPLTFQGAATLAAIVGLVACFLPASRAMRWIRRKRFDASKAGVIAQLICSVESSR